MMEGIDGSEVETIREALARAKKAAQIPLVETQIRDCENFLVRARTHFKAIDAHRATVVGLAGGVGEDLPVDHPRPKSGTSSRTNFSRMWSLYIAFCGGSHDSMRDTRLPHVMETGTRCAQFVLGGRSRSVPVEICQVQRHVSRGMLELSLWRSVLRRFLPLMRPC